MHQKAGLSERNERKAGRGEIGFGPGDGTDMQLGYRLKPVTTQHALTTQHLLLDGTTAKATTYFTGVHLGRGRWEGQQVTAYGKYVDELLCVSATEAGNSEIEAGASGVWKIKSRTVTFFGRVGEEGVMGGNG